MADEMIAFCGLICTDCRAYQATQANDPAKIEETARIWSKDYGHRVEPANVWCDGCLVGGRKCQHCGECKIRACAQEKKVENCGHCPDYACDTLKQFMKVVPAAERILKRVRAGS